MDWRRQAPLRKRFRARLRRAAAMSPYTYRAGARNAVRPTRTNAAHLILAATSEYGLINTIMGALSAFAACIHVPHRSFAKSPDCWDVQAERQRGGSAGKMCSVRENNKRAGGRCLWSAVGDSVVRAIG